MKKPVFAIFVMGPGFAPPEIADAREFADVNAVRAELLERFRGSAYCPVRKRTVYWPNVTTEAFALIWHGNPADACDNGWDTADEMIDFNDPILDAYLQLAG